MTVFDRALSERTQGGLPISIATSTAIESACGILPDPPDKKVSKSDKAPVRIYGYLLVNIRTLIRNIYSCTQGEVKKQLQSKDLLPYLMEEMTVIESTVSKASEGMCQVIFYFPTYVSIKRRFSNAFIITPNTDIQKHYSALEGKTFQLIRETGAPFDIREWDVQVPVMDKRTLIMTHYPVDLLGANNGFKSLWLLESHTGKIKSRLEFYTKLGKSALKEEDGVSRGFTIPFNEFALQVFGDNGNHFSPMPLRVRRAVLEIAEKFKWTMLIGKDRIKLTLRHIEDSEIRESLMYMV